MKVKRKHVVLFLVLIGAMLLLSGCGVSRQGVDVIHTAPQGPWQTFVVWPMAKALIWLNELLDGLNVIYSWGFAIILFTLIIKVITLPLTMTSLKGMKAQKDLQPKLQELQKKYGKNREKLAQEQMKLYQEAGVNPLSGCLPMVVQMPVLFGLYSALVALGPRLNDAHFFWIPDLGFPHFAEGLSWIPQLYTNGEYTRLVAYLILPVLLMISQVFMQRMTTAAAPPSGDGGQGGMMKQMSTMMTLMFGFFTIQVPAGLTLYWVTSNLLQMGQQYAVNNLDMIGGGASDDGSKTIEGTAQPVESKPSKNGAKAEDGSTDTSDDQESNASKTRQSRRQRKKRRK